VNIEFAENEVVKRAFQDIVLLAATTVVLIWIVFDFTIVTFFNFVGGLCADELKFPENLAGIESEKYGDRLKRANILGSYKLANHPEYKLPYLAYLELMRRKKDMKNKGVTLERFEES
jgi:hypothetical protein